MNKKKIGTITEFFRKIISIEAEEVEEVEEVVDEYGKVNIKTFDTCDALFEDMFVDSPDAINKQSQQDIYENTFQSPFFEEPGKYKIIITEKAFSSRKKYTIGNGLGKEIYIARSEGGAKIREIGVYRNDVRIGSVEKELFANPILGDPTYTAYWNGKKIVSLLQKIALKLKFEMLETGWKVDIGIMNSSVYDCNGDVIVQIKYVMSAKDRFIVEYYDDENETIAILLALTSIVACHMG